VDQRYPSLAAPAKAPTLKVASCLKSHTPKDRSSTYMRASAKAGEDIYHNVPNTTTITAAVASTTATTTLSEKLRQAKRQAKLQHFYDNDSSDYSSDDDEYGSIAVKASVSTSTDDSSDYSSDDDEYGSIAVKASASGLQMDCTAPKMVWKAHSDLSSNLETKASSITSEQLTWSRAVRRVCSLSDPLTGTLLPRELFEDSYGQVLRQLDGTTMSDYFSFFFCEDPTHAGHWIFRDEDARNDFIEWCVAEGLLPSLEEVPSDEDHAIIDKHHYSHWSLADEVRWQDQQQHKTEQRRKQAAACLARAKPSNRLLAMQAQRSRLMGEIDIATKYLDRLGARIASSKAGEVCRRRATCEDLVRAVDQERARKDRATRKLARLEKHIATCRKQLPWHLSIRGRDGSARAATVTIHKR